MMICKRCSHEWIPRVEEPAACPDCKSHRWKEEKRPKLAWEGHKGREKMSLALSSEAMEGLKEAARETGRTRHGYVVWLVNEHLAKGNELPA